MINDPNSREFKDALDRWTTRGPDYVEEAENTIVQRIRSLISTPFFCAGDKLANGKYRKLKWRIGNGLIWLGYAIEGSWNW